ncbi:MAG: hypothetical protein QOG48_1235 [Verrucomicrobiota bacterium]|jgi:hypothetical protein
MRKDPVSKSAAFFNPRALLAVILCSSSVALAVISFVPPVQDTRTSTNKLRYMPQPGGEADDFDQMERDWHNRLTYPTGLFNPQWLRLAAAADALIPRGIPAGVPGIFLAGPNAPLALNSGRFTSLGPAPLRMTGCSLCFDYTITEGRVNDIVIDPTTTTQGSIVAYLGSDGGGVWKTTNCCTAATSWTSVTDDPLLATINIDTLTIDPNNHNVIYAGTGDLTYGTFSSGSQGILKSTNAGASWTLLGANVFGPGFPEQAGQFPQYQAVGKVRVDPRNSNNVVAGTKTGLYFSYDAGTNWTGPCTTNNFTGPVNPQRQDITGLELSNVGGTTRIIAAVGVRGYATPVQYNLNQNGANGIYKGTMPASGCPTDFTPITTNANGWTGTNATSGVPCNNPIGDRTSACASNTNQLGRIDIAVAPSNPNYIYAQVQSITPNNGQSLGGSLFSGCGGVAGCQLAAWRTTNGGATWTQIPGSPGDALRECSGQLDGDYPQNWYDQGIAVDPNNPDRVFFDTFEIWFWQSGNTSWNDTTCGYSTVQSPLPLHVDQHALAFVPGSSSILLAGSDGGVYATLNADTASATVKPAWINMDLGLNTIEFYSGDISGNFATSAAPQANGGAQDNGSSSVTFTGSPTGPAQWQMGTGGDGFFARIDPVGVGPLSLRFFQGGNGGAINRCVDNCTAGQAVWTDITGGWSSEIRSGILPYEIYKDVCGPAGPDTGCGHLIAGSNRVWETITGAKANPLDVSWYANSDDLTKGTLADRSYINQLAFEPADQTTVIAGTNDGNVQIGFGMGTGIEFSATWVNVTSNNLVLPNRPILDVAFDPTTTTAPIGYAAVGGFNANTPPTPGHVFRVVCTASCASFSWSNKTGNLPDVPVDSIIANPKFPQQVFAGTDWGLYFTNDITAVSPLWYRFDSGLPHSMIWDMQIDRGATTLSVWTRSRGAYAWPLPSAPLPMLVSVVSRKSHGAAGNFDVDLTPPASGIECRSGGANGDYTMIFTFSNPVTSCGVASSGTATNGPNPNQCTVQLTGVPNAQYKTVQLTGVVDNNAQALNASGTMGVLLGDTTADKNVNSSDISQTKSQSGQFVTSANFREDVTVDGNLNSSDIGLVKSKSGTGLP